MKKKIRNVLLVCLLAFPLFASGSEVESGTGYDMTHLMTILVLQLAVIVIMARFLGFIFNRFLKMPQVLGWLSAGIFFGPHALGSIILPLIDGPIFPLPVGSTLPVSPELYAFGVVASIILLFFAGLETDLPTFIKFSGVGSAVGLGGVVLSFIMGDMTAVLFFPGIDSFMDTQALFLGTLSTATSVGITAKILSEKRKMSSPEGVTILAGAVLDDVLGIIILAVVVGISKVRMSGGSVEWGHIGIIAAKALGFWVTSTILGILLAPKLTKSLKWFQSMEVIAGIALGLALLFAGLSEMAGLAMIIGAYVLGLSLSQTDMAQDLMRNLQGAYRFLVPIFFGIMGMMVDFSVMKGHILIFGLIYSGTAMLSKIIGCGLPAFMTKFNLHGSLRIGSGMLPRGEVTLIVAGIGLTSGAIGTDIFSVAIITMFVASIAAPPILVKVFDGGSGLRSDIDVKKKYPEFTPIKLEFPSKRMADFIREEIVAAFKNEEFFTHRVDFTRHIYHVRKDQILITLFQEGNKIELNTSSRDEPFVRLLVSESLLVLKDLLSGSGSMQSPDSMGADLLGGLFEDES